MPTRKKTRPHRRRTKPVPAAPLLPPDESAFLRARGAFETGALGEATLLAEKALAINPNRADAHAFLGACWVKRGDQARGLEHAQRATELQPGNPRWWNSLGWAHLQLRQFEEAKTAYLRAISADPNLAEAYYSLARVALQLGESQAAADHLVQALALREDLVEQAKREFSQLADHPALASWLAADEEDGRPRRKPGKAKAKKPKRRR